MLKANSIGFPRTIFLLPLLAYDELIYPTKVFSKFNYVPGLSVPFVFLPCTVTAYFGHLFENSTFFVYLALNCHHHAYIQKRR